MATTSTKRTGKAPAMPELTIPEDEAAVVNLKEKKEEEKFREMEGKVVIAKVISQKQINKTGLRNSLRTLWEELEGIQMTEISSGIFAFTFKEKQHAKAILDGRPWFVLNSLFSVQPWNFNIPYQEVNFDFTPFWVQVHGLPLGLLNTETVRVIVERVGRILEIENPIVEGMIVRAFARVRLEVNTAKPLWAGSWVNVGDDINSWVGFKYEGLVGLCYGCGNLGHEQRFCKLPKVLASFDKSKPKFGSFLATTKPKPIEWLVNENRISGIQVSNMQGPMLNTQPVVGQNEAEGGESLASNEIIVEQEAEEVEEEGRVRGIGYNLRPRVRGQHNGNDEQGQAGFQKDGFVDIGTEGGGSSFGLKRQVGFIEMQDRGEDQHQIVLYTRARDGINLEARDLLEIDTAGGKWIEIGQNGSIKEMETGGNGQDCMIVPGEEAKKMQEVQYTQISNCNGNVYHIEFPEGSDISPQEQVLRLDCVTEKELIGTWNERLTLKRDRRQAVGLEAVEEELLRRKKQKREAWYDEHGKILCITVSDEFGTRTLVRNEAGQLQPQMN